MTQHLDIRKLLEQGHEIMRQEHAAKEQEVLGHPRIGSIGIVADDDRIYGVCHRKGHARQLGIDTPVAFSQEILFKAGEANEDTWDLILSAAKRHPDSAWNGKLLSHDDVPVKSHIPGVPLEVLGHPDKVLADDDGNPILGIELKGIFGYTTAISVYYENTPKNDNLIQSAGYSYFKKLPYVLAYTSPSWVKLQFDRKKYGDSNIKPFYRMFYLEWRDEVLWYRDEFQTDWVKTNITPQGIKRYYQLLEEMKQAKELGPRPTADYVHGKPNKWDACGLCEWKLACERYDQTKDYDGWIEDIKHVTTE